MSQSLKHRIPWHPGQLSSLNTSVKVDRNPKIGDDVVTLTDNDAGGSISISMIFELHAVAVDDDVISVLLFPYHSLSFFFPWYLCL